MSANEFVSRHCQSELEIQCRGCVASYPSSKVVLEVKCDLYDAIDRLFFGNIPSTAYTYKCALKCSLGPICQGYYSFCI